MICIWIEANLENRIVKSTLSQATIKARVGGGCPQEGVLSLLSWSTLVDDILIELSTADFYCLGYADDIIIVARGKFAGVTSGIMQATLNIVALKTHVVNFTKQMELPGLKPLVLDVTNTAFHKKKYLGVHFDHRKKLRSIFYATATV